MPLFQDLAEILASLSPRRPRRGQSDDQKQTDSHSIHQHSHSSLAPHHSSQAPASRPSRRIQSSWNKYSLGSASDDAHLSSPRLLPNCDTAARLQVCDTPRYLFATVLSGSFWVFVRTQYPRWKVAFSVDGLFVHSTTHTQLFRHETNCLTRLRVMTAISTNRPELQIPADNCGPHLRSLSQSFLPGKSTLPVHPNQQAIADISSGSGSLQMLGRDQKRTDAQARQEEARLLGARDYKYGLHDMAGCYKREHLN